MVKRLAHGRTGVSSRGVTPEGASISPSMDTTAAALVRTPLTWIRPATAPTLAEMKITAGRHVWIRCEVKPGAFADERIVRIHAVDEAWTGFVATTALREPIESGESLVKSLVLEVSGETILAQPHGEAVGPSLVRVPLSTIADGSSVAA